MFSAGALDYLFMTVLPKSPLYRHRLIFLACLLQCILFFTTRLLYLPALLWWCTRDAMGMNRAWVSGAMACGGSTARIEHALTMYEETACGSTAARRESCTTNMLNIAQHIHNACREESCNHTNVCIKCMCSCRHVLCHVTGSPLSPGLYRSLLFQRRHAHITRTSVATRMETCAWRESSE